MSYLPHTLDNLTKKEKEKVFDMLKQLNELKKRCAALEQEGESTELEHQRLVGREELMSRQLDSTQAKLLEAVECAKESQVQVDGLAQRLQQSGDERRRLDAALRECAAEAQALRGEMAQLKARRDRITVTAATQARIILSDQASNTADAALDRRNAAVQAAAAVHAAPAASAAPAVRAVAEAAPASRPPRAAAPERPRAPAEPPAPPAAAQLEPDEELAQLIAFLNPF
jgi:regulator of replication initiation timing